MSETSASTRRSQGGKRLTFVLTLALSNTGRDDCDLQRVGLLLASLDRYFDKDGLERLIIVAPARDMPRIREAVTGAMSRLAIDIVDEDEVCPEFGSNPDTLNNWPRPNTGWFRQQLIKLAIHRHVTTPFYMTLDSDVLFVREFDLDSLFPGGKAALNVQTTEDFNRLYTPEMARHEAAVRQTRHRQAEGILRVERDRRYAQRWYGETPVLLSCAIVAELADHVAATWDMPWRRALLEKLPWTEYALYFQFAEARQLLDDYYAAGGADTVLRLSQSLWHPAGDYARPRDLSDWNADEIFEVDKEGVAVVVQSYLGYPVDEIAGRVGRFVS